MKLICITTIAVVWMMTAVVFKGEAAKSTSKCYFGKEFVQASPVVDDGRVGLFTLLHYFVDRNDFERARNTINGNPLLVNSVHMSGISPLHLAACKGYTEMVKLLLSSGANVNAKDPNNRTPAEVAEAHGHKEVAELLKKHGN